MGTIPQLRKLIDQGITIGLQQFVNDYKPKMERDAQQSEEKYYNDYSSWADGYRLYDLKNIHTYFQIFTDKGIYRYQIFAYADVPADSFVYQVPYGTDDSFTSFIQQLKKQSYYDTGVDVTQKDKVVTLSTCSTTGKRFIVNAVRVDEYLY